MGFAKNLEMEQRERGYSAPLSSFVCDQCLTDPALRALVGVNAIATTCDFCGRVAEEPIAASTEDVLERIGSSLQREWESPEDAGLIWDQEEQAYAGVVPIDTAEAIWDSSDWPFAHSKFEEFVLDAFSEAVWVRRDPFALNEGEALRFSWQLLRETVMHEARFIFALLKPESRSDDPGHPIHRGAAMLERVGHLITEYGLFADLTPEKDLFRVRVHKPGAVPATAGELGAPPPERARQSRMSPAGIPMLYVAGDDEAALAESVDPERVDGKVATLARFRLRQAVRIVDLAPLPEVPSLFETDEEVLAMRPRLGFLHGFRRDVSAPIERDDRIHIEYVPTQLVCEYLRHLFRDSDGQPVHGLAFESSRRAGGWNIVLFIDGDHCLEIGQAAPYRGGACVELAGAEERSL